MEREAFQPGETIFNVGDTSDRAFLIIIGEVCAQLPNGRMRSLGPGEMFGEMGLIDALPRSATVVANRFTVCAQAVAHEASVPIPFDKGAGNRP